MKNITKSDSFEDFSYIYLIKDEKSKLTPGNYKLRNNFDMFIKRDKHDNIRKIAKNEINDEELSLDE